MLFRALLSLLSGLLTVAAPCVLPFLPVIVGGSMAAVQSSALDAKELARLKRRRAYIVCASLTVSLIVFTLLLKASTALIGLDPWVWSALSASLVIFLGLSMLFPNLWETLEAKLRLSKNSHSFLQRAMSHKDKTFSAVLCGVALGPVFSSCSPTYLWLVAQVLPVSAGEGILYLILYCIGVAASLLALSLLGQRILARVSWAADPNGIFQKVIAVLFILVGIALLTGFDRELQSLWITYGPTLLPFEETLIPRS